MWCRTAGPPRGFAEARRHRLLQGGNDSVTGRAECGAMEGDGPGVPPHDGGLGSPGVAAPAESDRDRALDRSVVDPRRGAHECVVPRTVRFCDVGMWQCPDCGELWRMEATRSRAEVSAPVFVWVRDPFEV